MNNLHRELAPISDAAWVQIEEGKPRERSSCYLSRAVALWTFTAARRFCSFGRRQPDTCAHHRISRRRRDLAPARCQSPGRTACPVRSSRRQMIDDVERGANDSDWQPTKDAARKLAFAEDRAIFEGYSAAGIVGVRQGTSNPEEISPRRCPQVPGKRFA